MENKSLSPALAGAFIALCFVWGTTYLGIKLCIVYLPAFMLSGIRHLTAGLILTAIFLIRGAKLPDWKDLKKLFFIGCLLIVGGNGLICTAEKYISSGFTAVLSGLTPLYITLLSLILLKNTKITVVTVAGMLISFLGVVILSYPNMHDSLDALFYKGFCLIILANLFWSLGSVMIKRTVLKVDTFLGLGVQMLMAGGVSIVISLVFEDQKGFKPLDVHFFSAMAYLIVAGSIVGYFCYFYLLKRMVPARVSVHNYINTVVAVLAGWLVVNEKVSFNSLFAMGVILTGVLIVNYEFGRINAAVNNKELIKG